MKNIVYTIGHSTRTLAQFIELLKKFEIKLIIDIRTIPKSRYNPQFNSEKLKEKLELANVKYIHIKELGGLRHSKKESINLGWKNLSFRGFADYMQTKDFEIGLGKLIKLSKNKTAIMCAESVPWRCHRSLIADVLVIRKIQVLHIINKTNILVHKLTPFSRIKNNKITYPKI